MTGLLGSFVQIPMMSLYGVLTSMTIDYNEWKYDKKLVAMSGGAIGFGSKVGNGLGAAILSAFLAIGAYDATLEVASTSMIYYLWILKLSSGCDQPCDVCNLPEIRSGRKAAEDARGNRCAQSRKDH